MAGFLNRYFRLEELQTNVRTEIVAGLSTYLSLAYILVLNPAILGHAGMDTNAILFATAIASAAATLAMGLWARLPFAEAPGIELGNKLADNRVRPTMVVMRFTTTTQLDAYLGCGITSTYRRGETHDI
jgi:adenine/guanine/hypoxanthine permease